MQKATTTQNNATLHRAHLGVECPRCHWQQFVEIHLDNPVSDTPAAIDIRHHLEAWMASHCPDHLNAISRMSKN